MYQDVAIVFLQSDSGDDSITVDGNTGDRYVALSSLSDTQLIIAHRAGAT